MSERQTAHTRDRILKAAAKLFQLQGYHATGLNQIIKESDSPKGSLYYYFPEGKEQLAEEAIRMTDRQISYELTRHMERSSTSMEAFQAAFQGLIDGFESDEEFEGVPIGLLALETWSMSERLRIACERAFEKWKDIYTDKLIKDGFSRERAEELGTITISLMEGGLIQAVTKKSSMPLQISRDQLPFLLVKR